MVSPTVVHFRLFPPPKKVVATPKKAAVKNGTAVKSKPDTTKQDSSKLDTSNV